MKTEGRISAGQAKVERQMRLLAQKFDMRPVPFPLKVRRLRLGLGVQVGFCALPGGKIAMGFTSGKSLAPVAVAEGKALRPLKKLQRLVKRVEEVTLTPDGKGGEIAAVRDSFGSVAPLGRVKEEGGKWGLEDIRIPLPKSAITSLSRPAALTTFFMGVYLPCLICGFPLPSPTASVFYHFFTQNAGSAISSVLEDAKACQDFSLVTSGLELASAMSIEESGVKEALRGSLGSVSSSLENDCWFFSSPSQEGEEALKKLESFLNLTYYTSDYSPYPFGFWQFLDAMEKVLEDPLCASPYKWAVSMAGRAASKAKELGEDSLDPEGEWVERSAFFDATSSIPLPLPVDYSISFSSPPGKAALVLKVGRIWRIPEFLAPHPLGRRRLLFLFSLAAAKMLCAAAFGASRRLEEVDLFIESQDDFSPRSRRPMLLAKGSFSRGDFFAPGEENSAEEFFKARFKGDLVRSPYFSPIPSDKEWADPPFSSTSQRKPPEFSWEEVPRKYASALGTPFISDLSIDRQLVCMKAFGAFESIFELMQAGKMKKEKAEEKIASICRLMPDPEILQAGSNLSAWISFNQAEIPPYPHLERELGALLREAQRLAQSEGRASEAIRILEEGASRAEQEFDSDPASPSRYFHTYAERVVYNRFLASMGEYTVLLPSSLFSVHLELEELLSRQKDPRALYHANWQVLHAPATPLAHLNQYKELSAKKDWQMARAAAMNMLEVSVEAEQLAMAYRNLGYCFWMEGDIPLAFAIYSLAQVLDRKEEMIRTERHLLETVARSSHIFLPSAPEAIELIKERSIPDFKDLRAPKAAREAAEALVDCGLFLPAASILNSISTLPGASVEERVASSLFL
ncbi:MAG: hypothetical protein J6P35_00535 [Aeriscardovia sp.]|nr:hypothetical protein [Aeriscardovia sp.]